MLAGALLAGAPLRAKAQEPDSIQPLVTDPVVVTVLRTPIRLGEAPFAVSVLGRESLIQGKAGWSLEEALQGLPGVQVQNRFNYAVGERISIRGFGARSQFGVRGVKVLVDGIPATLPDGQSTLDHLDPGMLGRAEALRGPASALYGNGAGGVLRFETRSPAPRPFEGEARAVAGSDGLLRIEGTASGVLEQSHYMVSASRLGYDGFRTNPLDAGGDPYGRSERLGATAHLGTTLWGGRLDATVNAVDLDAENPGSLSDSLLSLGDRQAFRFNVLQGTSKQLQQGQAGLAWTGPVGGLQGEVAAYGVLRSVDNPIPTSVIDLDRRAGGFRALLRSGRLAGGTPDPGAARFGWVLGLEGDLQRDDRKNFENDGGDPGALTLDQLERVRSLGLLAQGTLGLGQRADVTAGIRYDRFVFEADDHLPASVNPDDSGDRTMDAFSPTAGVRVDLSPRISLYGNVSSSFETPTTTELVNRPAGPGGFNPDLDPQRGLGFEMGLRGEGGTAAFEVTVFHMDLSDELVPFEVPGAPGRTFFRNAGTSRRRGVEAALTAALRPWARVQLAYALTDAEFTDYEVDGETLAGNRIPGLAPHRLDLMARLGRGRWFGEIRVEYTDAIPVNDANTARSPSYWLGGLRAGGTALPVGRLTVSPFAGITNLLDERYSSSVVVNAFGGRYFEPGPGRSVYAGLALAVGGPAR